MGTLMFWEFYEGRDWGFNLLISASKVCAVCPHCSDPFPCAVHLLYARYARCWSFKASISWFVSVYFRPCFSFSVCSWIHVFYVSVYLGLGLSCRFIHGVLHYMSVYTWVLVCHVSVFMESSIVCQWASTLDLGLSYQCIHGILYCMSVYTWVLSCLVMSVYP